MVAVVVTMVLAAAIIGAIVAWLESFAASQIRNSLETDVRRALNIISDDVRATSNAVDYNQWPDNNAPTSYSMELGSSPADTDQHYFWRSGSHSLILIRPARDDAGEVIYDDPAEFTGKKDNYVYYVNTSTRTLYRRTIPVPLSDYPDNALTIHTCGTPTAIGGCPGNDFKLADNVKVESDGTPGFEISYYNNVGISVTGATSVRSVVITLNLSVKQGDHDIAVKDSIKMVFRNN